MENKEENEYRKNCRNSSYISQLDTAHCVQETEIFRFQNGEIEHYMWYFLYDFCLSSIEISFLYGNCKSAHFIN